MLLVLLSGGDVFIGRNLAESEQSLPPKPGICRDLV